MARGQVIGITGYSGVDGVVTFPWVASHVHWNVFLGGVLVDPFATPGETSLFRSSNDPRPHEGPRDVERRPSRVDPERTAAVLADLTDDARRRTFVAIADPARRATELLLESAVYPTRFRTPEAGRLLYERPPAREPRLDLPFRAVDFDGAALADDLGFR